MRFKKLRLLYKKIDKINKNYLNEIHHKINFFYLNIKQNKKLSKNYYRQ